MRKNDAQLAEVTRLRIRGIGSFLWRKSKVADFLGVNPEGV